jgi:prepilin-type N-terminal cleavage/methylation domain-containing protein
MTHKRSHKPERHGFTLLELLVVIVIIAILASLLAAAVYPVLKRGNQVRTVAEIKQLEVAVESFKKNYGAYPPSRLKLCQNLAFYDRSSNQLDIDSVAFLQTIFPRIDVNLWSTTGIPWCGQLVQTPAKFTPGTDFQGAWTLEGDQVLVFCLGGIPTPPTNSGPPTTQGFTTTPTNPADIANPNAKWTPGIYEFQSSRLVRIPHPYNPGVPFFSYLDNNGTSNGSGGYLSGSPYLYFSSYKIANGYNRYLSLTPPAYLTPQNGLPFSFSDCYTASLIYATSTGASAYTNSYASQYPLSPTGCWPYAQSPSPNNSALAVYQKPNSFQIISAGADMFFGPGTVPGNPQFWTPNSAPTMNPQGSPGYDDLSSFTGALLGIGQD